MNKKEAIDELKKYKVGFGEAALVRIDRAVSVIRQIHEPQKPVVPQFVAEWIESKKEYFSDSSAIYMYDNLTLDNNGGYYHDVWLWAIAHHHDFIKAWHDGYDVEKEPLYQIFMKNTTNHKNQIQQLVKQGNKWFFCGNDVHRFKTKFTKGQIEAAGFGWVFDCKGVKVKEVE
jgi:hypothetical protein